MSCSLREIIVDLDRRTVRTSPDVPELFGKALAVRRVIEADDPERIVYVTGYTPMAASGLGFAGKLGVYGESLLGGNLQGSRSGGLAAHYLTRHGIVGVSIIGDTERPTMLVIDARGTPSLMETEGFGEGAGGTAALSAELYGKLGNDTALAVTDPGTTGFLYNAVVCNTRPGRAPDRAAARSTTRFGRNGLVGIAVARTGEPRHGLTFDRKTVAELLRRMHATKRNPALIGNSDPEQPLLGGTYGAAARARFEQGHALTDLFRSARVPEDVYERLLPQTIARENLSLARESGVRISRRPCLPGCPNRCIQSVLVTDAAGQVQALKSGEWETYQGVINLGLFDQPARTSAEILGHSNEYAYDHIEALVTLAALALVTETQKDTGVRYGDTESVLEALRQAAEGHTEFGQLIRQGAAAVERRYGIQPHFTVGDHALPFHNGRSVLQTGVGLSWTYGRHGESCAGPGRHNFLGKPYDPEDHHLDPRTHVLNTIHGMVMYGALDEQGMCFFMGPSIDTLVDLEVLLQAMNLPGLVPDMLRSSSQTILDVHGFNRDRGVEIQPLPRVFYDKPTHGQLQTPDRGVTFTVPFQTILTHGRAVLKDVALGHACVPNEILSRSRSRYG